MARELKKALENIDLNPDRERLVKIKLLLDFLEEKEKNTKNSQEETRAIEREISRLTKERENLKNKLDNPEKVEQTTINKEKNDNEVKDIQKKVEDKTEQINKIMDSMNTQEKEVNKQKLEEEKYFEEFNKNKINEEDEEGEKISNETIGEDYESYRKIKGKETEKAVNKLVDNILEYDKNRSEKNKEVKNESEPKKEPEKKPAIEAKSVIKPEPIKPKLIKEEKTEKEKESENEKVKSLREKIFGMFRGKESPKIEEVEQVTEELENEKAQEELSAKEIESLEKILESVEKERMAKLENGPLPSRIKKGVINGLDKWENFGKDEKGAKGFAKRFTKMAINLALIGAISSVSVQKLAEIGVGTASALSGGVTSYLGKKMIIGLGLGGIMEAGGGKIPGKVKKWMPLILGGASMGVAAIFTGGAAGIAAGLSFGAGYAASRLVKGRFLNEKIIQREEEAKQKFTEKIKEEGRILKAEDKMVGIDRISEIENEYAKILKKYENQRLWGKLLDGAKKLGVGALTSAVSLEFSGVAHDFAHHQAVVETVKESGQQNNADQTQPAQEHKVEINNAQKETELENGGETKMQHYNELRQQHEAEIKHQEELKQQEEIKQPEEIKNGVEPKTDVETKIEHNINPNAIVHKGEGVTQAFAAQIKADHALAEKLGFTGDFDNKQDIAEFTKKLAINTGYMDGEGHEIRIAEADKIAYEIKIENGHIVVDEKTVGGEVLETHHEGDKFEQNPDKYEYSKNPEIKTENIIDDKYAPPPQVNPETGIPAENNNFIPSEQVNPENDIPINTNHTSSEVDNGNKIQEQANPVTGEQTNNTHIINNAENSGDKNQINNTSENLGLNHNLPLELLEKANQTYENNIHQMFPNEKSLQAWDSLKDSHEMYPATKFIHWDKPINDTSETFRPLVSHMQKLHEITGVEPIEKSILNPVAETPEEYIIRATQKAAEMGKLDEVKL